MIVETIVYTIIGLVIGGVSLMYFSDINDYNFINYFDS
jgi:predicted ribosomally synthesized peptide with SipW-like signal peptide